MKIKGGTSWLIEINSVIDEWDMPTWIKPTVWWKKVKKIVPRPLTIFMIIYLSLVIWFAILIICVLVNEKNCPLWRLILELFERLI